MAARRTSLRPSRGRAGLDPAATHARLSLLGGFELRAGPEAVRLPPHVQRLLAFLALQGRPLHRAYVAGRLWIDGNQEHAHACLRTTLWRTRCVPVSVVEVSSTHLALASCVAVDVRELEDAAERILHDASPPAALDVELVVGASELLPDSYDDWILDEREQLRQLRLVALEAAGEGLIRAQRHSEAAVAALAAVRADPLRETAYRILIRACLAEGNVAEALHQFVVFRAQLRRELGLEPSPQILELVRGIA
jgi:DNA-binding SARP family transcriptional activator